MRKLLMLLLWAPVGCSRGPGLPLKEGKVWTYVTSEGARFTLEITGRDRIREQSCYVMALKSEGKQVMASYLSTEGRGIRELRTTLGDVDIFFEEPKWFLRGPLEVGAQFGERIRMGPPFGGQLQYMGTFEVEEEVTVPAGTFKCWRIKYIADLGNILHVRETRWLCPGVGFVKYAHQSGIQGQVIRLEGDLESVN